MGTCRRTLVALFVCLLLWGVGERDTEVVRRNPKPGIFLILWASFVSKGEGRRVLVSGLKGRKGRRKQGSGFRV